MSIYQSKSFRAVPLWSLLVGVGVTLLIFLIIPLSQLVSERPDAPQPIQSVSVALPPPAPPPPDPPPPQTRETEPPPELSSPPPMPNLEQIAVSLRPGTGGALTVGLGGEFDFGTESVEALSDLFDFGDLDEVPQVVRAGRIEYPNALRRAGTEGYVQLVVIIDEEGRVTVDEVVEFTHRPFVPAAVRGAEGTRFSSPTRQGQAVRARYLWTIRFSLGG